VLRNADYFEDTLPLSMVAVDPSKKELDALDTAWDGDWEADWDEDWGADCNDNWVGEEEVLPLSDKSCEGEAELHSAIVPTAPQPSKRTIQADGANAKILEPEVPVSKRRCSRQAPDVRLRSEGDHLHEDFEWWMARALDEDGIPLRDAEISDPVARAYWNRFLLLVEVVDQQVEGIGLNAEGTELVQKHYAFDTAFEYLQLKWVAQWLNWYGENLKVTKKTGVQKPYSPEYVTTLVRAVRALANVFVIPMIGGPRAEKSLEYHEKLSRLSKSIVHQLKILPKSNPNFGMPYHDAETEQLVWLSVPTVDLISIKSKLKVFEDNLQKQELMLAGKGRKQDQATKALRLKVAEGKQALLASYLLLWHCGRAQDIRQLVTNWDIRLVKDVTGKLVGIVDPVETKVKWRSLPKDLAEDPGKILHEKVFNLYKDYLKRWRPVLERNLGERAQYDVTFTSELHGLGSEHCKTLFPGFWPENQNHTFVARCWYPVLGCSERRVRKVLTKAMPKPVAAQWGIPGEALDQHFHHSRDVTENSYSRGSRNLVNAFQAHVLGWDP
jgi:hypothetical protein